jgi:DNA mismatch repair protein MutS2
LLDPETVVPIDVDPREGTRAIVITGPNTGGKTVSLKTVGLLVLMAQSGLHIPRKAARNCPSSNRSMPTSAMSNPSSSRFPRSAVTSPTSSASSKQMDHRSLVIFDELGSGTDPQEGAAIARAILTHLLETGAMTLVATHYPN